MNNNEQVAAASASGAAIGLFVAGPAGAAIGAAGAGAVVALANKVFGDETPDTGNSDGSNE